MPGLVLADLLQEKPVSRPYAVGVVTLALAKRLRHVDELCLAFADAGDGGETDGALELVGRLFSKMGLCQ
jgi:hypothetical protein